MQTMTDKDTTYNGWANYPTWAVNMWLGNDEVLYNQAVEMSEAYVDTDRPMIELADSIKTWVRDELAPDLGASFAAGCSVTRSTRWTGGRSQSTGTRTLRRGAPS